MDLDVKELGFSQTSVSYEKRRKLLGGEEIKYTYDDIKDNLYNNGWPKDEFVDAIIMPPDGKLTCIDNTRLTAIHELGGVDKHGNPIKAKVRVRRPDEDLGPKEIYRFTDLEKGFEPKKWWEVTRERIRNQTPKRSGQEYRIEGVPRVSNRPQ